MKIRHPLLIKAAGFALGWFIRRWGETLSIRLHCRSGDPVWPETTTPGRRFIYCFWHEDLPAIAARFSNAQTCVMISEHADGRLIAEACRYLRLKTVAGSDTRGGVKAVRDMLRYHPHRNFVITPDGPRGPRRIVKPGLTYLASRSGWPIIPVGVGYEGAWRMRSWDRLALPRPGSQVHCFSGTPIAVPPNASRDDLAEYGRRLQRAMDEIHALAEARAGERGPSGETARTRLAG